MKKEVYPLSGKQTNKSLNSLAMKAGFFYIVSQLFVRGISFLTAPVFSRLLSKAQYAEFSRFESWLLIFAPIMSLCLWRSVERAKYDVKERFNEYVSSVQTLSYLSIAVFFVVFWYFRDVVERLCSMTDFMLLVAFLYTFAHTSIFYMQRREKQMMRYRASTTLTACTVIPATLLSVALVCWGKSSGHEDQLVNLRILGYYTPMIIGGFTVAVLMLVQGRKLVSLRYWGYALRFSLPLIPEVLSIQIMNQSDKLMVIEMTGKENGSVIALATQVSYIIWIIEDSVWNAWLPWMYEKLSTRDTDGIQESWTVLMHGFGVFSWLLVAFAPEIILILGGRKYADAIYLVAPLVTGTLFRFYSYSYTAIQNYHKKTGFVAMSTVFSMVLNIILNYAGIRLFGYRAAAYTTAFSYLVLLIVQAQMEKHLTGEKLIPLRKTLLISCSWFTVCMVTMLLFQVPMLVRYLIVLCTIPFILWYFLPKMKMILKCLKK
jgi:O-antigen/teichoic acid export membrane protein